MIRPVPLRRAPVFSLAYLLLCLLFKAFQLWLLTSEHRLGTRYWLDGPGWFVQDVWIALGVWLVLDLAPFWVRAQWWRRLGQGLFLGLVLYQALMVKFYYLFGTSLTQGLFEQVDRFDSYRDSILHEVDAAAIGLMVAAAAFFVLTARLARRDRSRPEAFSWRHPTPVVGLGLLLYLALVAMSGRVPHPRVNYHGLDKNPLFELLASSLAPARIPVQPGQAGPQTPQEFSRSAAQAQAITPRRLLLPRSSAWRQDLNVVFVLMESLTPDYTGLTHPELRGLTPNLCRIAARSLVFDRHYCQEPATLKSLYSLLTGKYSYQTRDWKSFLDRARNDPTLPERLRAHGYATAFLTSADGRVYLQNDYLRRRFDRVQDMAAFPAGRSPYPRYDSNADDRVLADAFEAFLSSRPNKFFIVLSPYAPHHPYTLYPPEYRKVPGATRFANYQNSIYFADAVLGRFFASLEDHGLLDRTLIVIVSDHGEAFEQHPGNRLHSIYLYEENVHTVFLLSQPGLLPPGRYAGASRHIDVAPTVLGFLGVEAGTADGQDLLAPHPETCVFFYTSFSDRRLGLEDGPWKYIFNATYGTAELYCLPQDPGELHDMAAQNPALCRTYQDKVEALDQYTR